jgi:hypothetical protein
MVIPVYMENVVFNFEDYIDPDVQTFTLKE